MADQKLLAIVWGETSGLAPKDRSNQTLARLQAVVAKLAAAAKRRGLSGDLKQKLAPRANEDAAMAVYGTLSSTVNAIELNTWRSDTELPARAVLWEINENGVPPRDNVPPKSVTWMFDPDVTHGGDFVAGDGADARTYRLFESAKVPAEGELPYVSGYTGAGIPAPSDTRRWYQSPNWWIGLSGGALFFLAAFSLLWTASSFSQAYDLLTNRQVGQTVSFIRLPCPGNPSEDQKKFCTTADEQEADNSADAVAKERQNKKLTDFLVYSRSCVDHLVYVAAKENPAKPTLTDAEKATAAQGDKKELDVPCLNMLGSAVTYSAEHLVIKADTNTKFPIGRWVQSIGYWLFGWHVPTDGTETVSLGMPTALMMLGVVLVLIGLGRGINGTPLGALISPNGRYSLALAQVTFWTILVLTSVMAVAIFNGGLASELVRYFPKATSEPVAAANGFFPFIPEGIWAVLGISFGSTVVSTLIKSLKGDVTDKSVTSVSDASSRQTGGIGFFNSPVARADPGHPASIADWFLGEDEGNKNKIDISRVQMVLITAGLLVTYGNAIFASIRDLPPQEILRAIQNVGVLIATLPPVGASMAIMLAVSHATYLVSKAADKPPPPQGTK